MTVPTEQPAGAPRPHRQRVGQGVGTERITAFSDGVYAIAITLLVLDLRLPDLPAAATAGELTAALFGLWPKLFAYGLSFVVIGFLWITHHRLFAFIRRYDSTLLWLNLLVLLFVALLPFPTVVMGAYGSLAPAVILYASTFVLISLSQTLLWVYASRWGHLVDPDLDPRIVTYVTLRGLTAFLIWLLSIPLALVDTGLAMLSWTLLGVMAEIVGRICYREEAEEREALEAADQ
jgi:uncharacterized membrane protein